MDSNRSKNRSFSKSKLIRTFYRAATKPSAAALQPYSNKPPKPTLNSPSPASVDFAANQPIKTKAAPHSSAMEGSPVGFIIVNQDQVFPPQTPKVAFVVTDRSCGTYGKMESFFGGNADDDEGVDARADRYISSVQERFRLERVNSESKNFEDIRV